MSTENKPVWQSPAWITAIVSLIGVFLTVPEIVGNYLTKEQDTEALRLKNLESKQEQEFKIVKNTLAQQGTERVFVLRYLAATLDDTDAKEWAGNEVKRLDELATTQEALSKTRQELSTKEEELQLQFKKGVSDTKKLEGEILTLQNSLKEKNSKISELRQKAGFSSDKGHTEILNLYKIWIRLPQSYKEDIELIFDDGTSISCKRRGIASKHINTCDIYLYKVNQLTEFRLKAKNLDIRNINVLVTKAIAFPQKVERNGTIALNLLSVPVECNNKSDEIICTKFDYKIKRSSIVHFDEFEVSPPLPPEEKP